MSPIDNFSVTDHRTNFGADSNMSEDEEITQTKAVLNPLLLLNKSSVINSKTSVFVHFGREYSGMNLVTRSVRWSFNRTVS